MEQTKQYLAFDAVNHEFEAHDTIEQAREWLADRFLYEGCYEFGLTDCKIYKLSETVGYDVVDKKENYKYESEDDIPDGADDYDDVWPYDPDFKEVWRHKFIPFE